MKASQPSASLGEIAKSLGTNKMKVKRTLDKLTDTVTPVTPVTPVTTVTPVTIDENYNQLPF